MEQPDTLEEIYRYPTTIHGGFAVRRIPGQGAGEIHADGNLTTDGALQAAGAVVAGACELGTPTCATTIRGPLVLEGPITAPSLPSADSVDMLLAPNQWTPVPPVSRGRLVLVLAESPATSAAFFVVQGCPGLVSTIFRETSSPFHIALRGGPDSRGLEIALLHDSGRDREKACGITGAIREVSAVPEGKEKEPCGGDEPAGGACGAGEPSAADVPCGSAEPQGGTVPVRIRFLAAAGGVVPARA